MYWVYLVACANNTLYTGITTDLARRIREHNTSPKGAKYTRAHRPVRLVYSQKHQTRSAAQKAESAIKKLSHAQKIQLIAS